MTMSDVPIESYDGSEQGIMTEPSTPDPASDAVVSPVAEPRISPTPRFDADDPRNPCAVALVLADLTVQVARIANALEYQLQLAENTSRTPATRNFTEITDD